MKNLPADLELLRNRIERESQQASTAGHFWPLVGGAALLALAAFAVLAWRFGLRDDAQMVGALALIAFFFVEFAAGVCLLYAVVRGSNPGRQLNLATCAALATIALVLHGIVAWLNYRASPVHVPEGLEMRAWMFCTIVVFVVALPVIALGWSRLARTLALRPFTSGGLIGLGAGLLGDAVWRLICDYSQPEHVLSHTMGLVVATGIGMTWGFVQSWLWRRRRR